MSKFGMECCAEGLKQGALAQRRVPGAVLALAVSIFVIGSAELLPMGLLIPIADQYGLSVSTAGLLVTEYALGVAVGGPLLTAATGRVDRKRLVVGLLLLFVSGSLLSALAPNFPTLLTGRLFSSLSHGALFGISVVAAGRLAPPGKEGAALSYLGAGLTLSSVLGAPAGTYIGRCFGWRMSFVAVAVAALVCMILTARFVPSLPREESAGMGKQARALGRPELILALLTTVFGFGGVFAGFTYISPFLQRITGFAPEMVSPLLLVFGIGSAVGNWLGGKLADRRLMPTLCGSLFLLVLTMAVFAWEGSSPVWAVILVFLWGGSGFAIVTPLNMLVLKHAGEAADLASSLNISAFNIGNALGAALGGAAIHTGFALRSAPAAGAGISAGGLVLLWILMRLGKNRMNIQNTTEWTS
ncbi:MAG: MFS transporter [Alicyclobacillaceae bacterium]|nr:MFS transporter [Alicyclobacillaceae bacterium]